jgi:hypothetical protein
MKRKWLHSRKSPLCGKTVRIKPGTPHHLYTNFAGRNIYIINWWDRTFAYSPYSIIASVYQARKAICNLRHAPENDVLLGIIDGRREIVHVSELEPTPEPDPLTPLPVAA